MNQNLCEIGFVRGRSGSMAAWSKKFRTRGGSGRFTTPLAAKLSAVLQHPHAIALADHAPRLHRRIGTRAGEVAEITEITGIRLRHAAQEARIGR